MNSVIKKRIAIGILLTTALPLLVFGIASRINRYMPPKDPSMKSPSQFEDLFNTGYARQDIYIDLTDGNWSRYDQYYVQKKVPVHGMEDRDVQCTIVANGVRNHSLVMQVMFTERVLEPLSIETKYLSDILDTLFSIFAPRMAADHSFCHNYNNKKSYDVIMANCISAWNTNGGYYQVSFTCDSNQGEYLIAKNTDGIMSVLWE